MPLELQACPKCRYVRQSADTAPAWQCPSCGVAYGKVVDTPSVPPAQVRYASQATGRRGWLKWVSVAAVVYGAHLGLTRPWRHGDRNAAIADANAAQPEVLLYATSWCGYCAQARSFFADHGIRYTEYDVEKDAQASKEHRRLGGSGAPTIVVGDEVLHGYDEQAVAGLLAPWLK